MKEAADRVITHYERHARAWDADRNRNAQEWNDKPWHERFVAALPERGATVLDLEHFPPDLNRGGFPNRDEV